MSLFQICQGILKFALFVFLIDMSILNHPAMRCNIHGLKASSWLFTCRRKSFLVMQFVVEWLLLSMFYIVSWFKMLGYAHRYAIAIVQTTTCDALQISIDGVPPFRNRFKIMLVFKCSHVIDLALNYLRCFFLLGK